MQPLSGMLVVDFSRYLPGAFASRELLELGARVVCVEPPGGDPMRASAPAWDAALRAGKDSLELDLKRDPAPALELLQEADVVLESFRHGVASRLGVGPEHVPERTVYCSITGFGLGGRHQQRAGHDLNYLRLGRQLWDAAPALPPVQIADLAAGGLGAVTNLAALLERDRTGKGSHVVVSMTRVRIASSRTDWAAKRPAHADRGHWPVTTSETADGRELTVAALGRPFSAAWRSWSAGRAGRTSVRLRPGGTCNRTRGDLRGSSACRMAGALRRRRRLRRACRNAR
jgi:crotonobetainyl-CoA:carnitine CoA-transferase CaiB-like acyl-CoA transferase